MTNEEVKCIERMTNEVREKYITMSVEARKQYSRTQRLIHNEFHQEVLKLEIHMKERELDFIVEYEEDECFYNITISNRTTISPHSSYRVSDRFEINVNLPFYMKERGLDFTLEYEEDENFYTITLVNFDTPVIDKFLDITVLEEVEA